MPGGRFKITSLHGLLAPSLLLSLAIVAAFLQPLMMSLLMDCCSGGVGGVGGGGSGGGSSWSGGGGVDAEALLSSRKSSLFEIAVRSEAAVPANKSCRTTLIMFAGAEAEDATEPDPFEETEEPVISSPKDSGLLRHEEGCAGCARARETLPLEVRFGFVEDPSRGLSI